MSIVSACIHFIPRSVLNYQDEGASSLPEDAGSEVGVQATHGRGPPHFARNALEELGSSSRFASAGPCGARAWRGHDGYVLRNARKWGPL